MSDKICISDTNADYYLLLYSEYLHEYMNNNQFDQSCIVTRVFILI